MSMKTIYRRFSRRIEEMDDYERMKLYSVAGIGIFVLFAIIGLSLFFYLRYLNVMIGVDTTGLLGKPAVFVDNLSGSGIKNVHIVMDGTYTADVAVMKSKQSVVVYFTSFKPRPPRNYVPHKIAVRSGFAVRTKSIAAATQ